MARDKTRGLHHTMLPEATINYGADIQRAPTPNGDIGNRRGRDFARRRALASR